MIYDCFTYNGEAGLLEIRFNILNEHVDKFVICESTETFSGKPKPLYWAERGDRFEEWEDKVIYHVVQIPKDITDSFERAGYQKDSIREALKNCDPEDTIYYGDVDEIWKPQEKEGKLRQLAYSYYLNNRSSEDWQGTNVCRYKNLYNLNEWRANHDVVLEDGGWHFTNVMPYGEIIRKVASYDHADEIPQEWFKNNLQGRIDRGEDYLGRSHDWKGEPFKMWIDESDLPKYILNNKNRYSHLFKNDII